MKADHIKKVKDLEIRELLMLDLIGEKDDTIRFISYALNAINNNQSLMLLIHAKQGTGKTVFQYYLKLLLGIKTKDIYIMDEFNQLIEAMPQKTLVNLLDGGLLFPSRSFGSKDQKALQKQVNVFRAFTNIYTISIPQIDDIDISIRRNFYEVEIKKIYKKRFAVITIENRKFVIDIPEFNKGDIQKIHLLDQKNKREGLKQ